MLKLTDNWKKERAPEALVHGVNLRGLLGTGLEVRARALNPGLDAAVKAAARKGGVVPGLVFPVPGMAERPRVVLLVATKLAHTEAPTREDLKAALVGLRAFLGEAKVRTVAVVALGEGLPPEEVLALLAEAFGDLPTEVLVEPGR